MSFPFPGMDPYLEHPVLWESIHARLIVAIAERDAQCLREQLEEREEEVESMRREMVGLRKEREEIRGRVEKMLAQIDRIEEPAAS